MEITGINTILKIYQEEGLEYWTRILNNQILKLTYQYRLKERLCPTRDILSSFNYCNQKGQSLIHKTVEH